MKSSRILRTNVLALACLAACPAAYAAHVDARLMAGGGESDALLVFAPSSQALTPLATDADYKLRRRALVEALRAHADTTQRDVRAWLDANGIPYRSYWIANVIEARLPHSALSALASRNDVLRVEPNPSIAMQLPHLQAVEAPAEPDTISWGVNKINAPAVWALGYNGQGVVIAGEDTGYQWDHPALQPHYRGWDGTNADHNYNWHDAIHDSTGNPCGNDSPFPCDDFGHGTHTAGTFAGDDGGSHQTGVAPGAKWIGCRNMDDGNGTPARYIECMQWMLAPTDLSGQNPNPDLAPDVVSNSWGCIASEGCTVGDEIEDAVNSVVAGGIFFAVAAANNGPACETITDPPAIYDASFVVGATDTNDRMAGFSSRGPVVASTLIRPDLSAPGVNVPSAWPPNTYQNLSGTSMATPHVAGTAALVMSVNPALKGHPDEVGAILRATTVTQGVTDPGNTGCGGLTINDWPNYQAGYGRLDALAAVVSADTIFADGLESAP
ncbi:MAG TPA: S8 family serine peptidase [Rhodanobacteraceae bacterium]|jgi:subtilisin family serine protease|nr:S8 family serine peptidase [Rhodanobacteraceae bacterium]